MLKKPVFLKKSEPWSKELILKNFGINELNLELNLEINLFYMKLNLLTPFQNLFGTSNNYEGFNLTGYLVIEKILNTIRKK